MSSNREWLNSLRRYTGNVFRETDDFRWPNVESPRYPRRPLTIEVEILRDNRTADRRRRGRLFSEENILEVTTIQPQIEANCRAHHCDRFSGSRHGSLIVRRGQAFQLVFQLTSQYRIDFDQIQLVFTYSGSRFISGQDGIEKVEVSNRALPNPDPETWVAQLTEIRRGAVMVEVTPSVRAAVGEWKLTVITQVARRNNLVGKSFAYNGPIFILFNPWSPNDDAYLSRAKEREEYVLADTGIIYSGRKDRISELAWVFGQHERNVLQIVLYALRELGDLDVRGMADPVLVSRTISSIINGHRNRDGIIEGNWSEKFHDQPDSRSPWEWSSSVEILELFYRKRAVVRYGQCFVFAGVCNTMCRALGLPARCVTNYRSAHDVHKNLVLDYLVDENDKMVSEKRNDSIWSFHVWNEVWMKRNDLNTPGDFDGWQVIDATPQEISSGEYRVGPTSVKAVRRGEVDVNYDGVFVLSEVNADVVYFRKTASGRKKEIKRLIDDVGFNISTKGVLNNERVDITDSYKPREGSTEERQIYQRALRRVNARLPRFSRLTTSEESQQEVKFELKKPSDFTVGETMQFYGVARNQSFERQFSIRVVFKVTSHTYAGTHKRIVKHVAFNETLEPRDAMEFETVVNYSEYAAAVREGEQFSVEMQGLVRNTDEDFLATEEVSLATPTIHIICDTHQKVGRPFDIKMSLRNPLPVSLTEAEFVLEAPGITKQVRLKVRREPKPGEHFSVDTQLTPKGFGKRNLVVSFHCKELHQISMLKQIYVLP